MNRRQTAILTRHPKNPILSPETMPFPCYAVFNAGAVRFEGKYLLLLRVAGRDRLNSYHIATSANGVDFDVNPEPIDYPLEFMETHLGVRRGFRHHQFEMRITPLDGWYYLCHGMNTVGGCCGVMARTKDFKTVEPLPDITLPENRNLALFPEKINGLYVRLDRPMNGGGGGTIWVTRSPDLRYWGDNQPLKMPATLWGATKSGPGTVPIKTRDGWLVIYHATLKNASAENYCLGVMLLDLADPAKILGFPTEFILAPEKLYECVGQVPNVVFTAGAVENGDGTLNLYYGGADTVMCLATASIQELVELCLEHRIP